MMVRVYRYGALPPIDGLALVRAQLRAAHDYRNDLVAIERGRRDAIRAAQSTPETREAEAALAAATRSTRKAALIALRNARKIARAAAAEELARIADLDAALRHDARALTSCYWGTYLDIEAAHQQARSAPLYADDGLTPAGPRFFAWRGDGGQDGQIGIQLQGGLVQHDALAGEDTRARLIVGPAPALDSSPQVRISLSGKTRGLMPSVRAVRDAVLWLRVGTGEGRAPIWAKVPLKYSRAIPDAARWKWVRVSTRREGPREEWSVEITVDDPAPAARSLDATLRGAIAVEWCWDQLDDGSIRAASWADDRGGRGDVLVPAYVAKGIRKPDGIRAVRDMIADDMRPRLARAFDAAKIEPLPPWLRVAAETVDHRTEGTPHRWLWHLGRLHDLAKRWRVERCDLARPAYEVLQEWELRDNHLWEYEACSRRQALRARREVYRVLAAQWSRRYRTALLSDQDLSREARWGEESAVRTTAACYELAGALRNAFGDDWVAARWKDGAAEDDVRMWCERCIAAWTIGSARDESMFMKRKEKTTNAWAVRRAKKRATAQEVGTARKADGNASE